MYRAFLKGAFLASCSVFVALSSYAQELPGTGQDEGKVVIYRDTWGVPHIYAPTEEAGLFAMGYAQAQDRPEQLLVNIKRALGEAASVFGEGELREDMIVRMFDHYGNAQRDADKQPPQVRKNTQAFAAGINAYYKTHPEDVPEWWGDRVVDEFMVDAFGRLFLYAWSIDQALGDLRRAGIDPGTREVQRGSNQFAVAPERSANGAPILYIDPHLSWTGVSRFWEFRIHAGEIKGSGFSLPANPYIGLGHNEHVAWAMTTGGPDTADIFEVTLKDGDPTQYLYDGEWRKMESKEAKFEVKDGDTVTETLYYTLHGPVVAWKGGKAYAAKTSYSDAAGTSEAWYHFNHAKDYKGIVEGLKTQAVFPQNVMVADTAGNIYYQRTGRVPVRAQGFNYDYPVNGSTSLSQWKGIHPVEDLLQVTNPPQGYMQNCNIPPDAMMVNSPFKLENTLPYIWADRGHGPRNGWTNQRGARAVQLLSNDDSVTVEEALSYAVNVHPYGVERWVEALKRAHEKHGARYSGDEDYDNAIQQMNSWNGHVDRNSAPGLKYAYWRMQIEEDWGSDQASAFESKIDNHMSAVGAPDKPIELNDEELSQLLSSFYNGLGTLKSEFGNINAQYGDRFRVGRDDNSWPVGGGGPDGLSCLRNIGFHDERDDHTQWGRSGQTSTEIVVLTNPIQSWTFVPLGQSDRPDSPHYDDQAEKLFSKRTLKPTWWLPEDLAKNIESREEITYDGAAAPAGEGSPTTDTGVISAIMTEWKAGVETLDIKKATANYADDYQDAQAASKEDVIQWLDGIIAQGILDNAEIDLSNAETEIDGEEAFYGPIELSADGGAFTIDVYFEKRDGQWKITSTDVY